MAPAGSISGVDIAAELAVPAQPACARAAQLFAYAAVPAHSDNTTIATTFDMVLLLTATKRVTFRINIIGRIINEPLSKRQDNALSG
jgi:hypothetical protein